MDEQFSQVRELQLAWPKGHPVDVDDLIEQNREGEWMLSGLPKGFGGTFWMGLGLPRRYRGIVYVIERNTPCTIVRFGSGSEGSQGAAFLVSPERFDDYVRAVERNRRRAQTAASRVNESDSHNAVADLLGLEPVQPHPGRNPVIQLLTRAVNGEVAIDEEDQRILVDSVRAESPRIASENPAAFGRLRDDIELVSLATLIDRYRANLDSHAKAESAWQNFFENNTFALQQLFAVPVVLYGAQLRVRYPNLRDRGARVADFVLVNAVTRSVYIVEIKTPGAGLTGKRFRGDDGAGVYLPGKELAGAVAQVQSQIESARTDLSGLIEKTPGAAGVDTLNIRGAVIVGRVSALDEEQLDSFRRFRTGLRDIEVLTFDEVLERLVGLSAFLGAEREAGSVLG